MFWTSNPYFLIKENWVCTMNRYHAKSANHWYITGKKSSFWLLRQQWYHCIVCELIRTIECVVYLNVEVGGGRRVLKIVQFSWTSYVYHSLFSFKSLCDSSCLHDLIGWTVVMLILLDKFLPWNRKVWWVFNSNLVIYFW